MDPGGEPDRKIEDSDHEAGNRARPELSHRRFGRLRNRLPGPVLNSQWQKSSRHSTVPASRRTALLSAHILPVCSLIAPGPAGAGTVSVLAGLSPRTVNGPGRCRPTPGLYSTGAGRDSGGRPTPHLPSDRNSHLLHRSQPVPTGLGPDPPRETFRLEAHRLRGRGLQGNPGLCGRGGSGARPDPVAGHHRRPRRVRGHVQYGLEALPEPECAGQADRRPGFFDPFPAGSGGTDFGGAGGRHCPGPADSGRLLQDGRSERAGPHHLGNPANGSSPRTRSTATRARRSGSPTSSWCR